MTHCGISATSAHDGDEEVCTSIISHICGMKVFISHASSDRSIARKAAESLSSAGFEVWWDAEILPGDNWAEEHARALGSSQAMVLLISAASLDSVEVRYDLSYALGQQPFEDRVVPVLVSSYDLPEYNDIPWVLRRMDTVDLDAFASPEDAFQRVADRLKGTLQTADD